MLKYFKKRKAQKEISSVKFDPDALQEHNITLDEIINTKFYIGHLQNDYVNGEKNNGWYNDIIKQADIIKRTKYLIHEIIEQRILRKRGVDLLKHKPEEARRILQEEHPDAHYRALKTEIDYLKKKHPKMKFKDLLLKYFSPEEMDDILDNLE